MSRQTILTEYWAFLKYRKKYWLTPILAILLVVGVLLAFASSSATTAPFMYSIF